MQRPARSPHRPDDENTEQNRPDPPEQPQHVITGAEDEKGHTGDDGAHGGRERPRLRLICSSASELDEQQHPESERDQGYTRDDTLLAAAEHPEGEHQPQNQPGGDRAEDDEPDMAPTVSLLACLSGDHVRYIDPASSRERLRDRP